MQKGFLTRARGRRGIGRLERGKAGVAILDASSSFNFFSIDTRVGNAVSARVRDMCATAFEKNKACVGGKMKMVFGIALPDAVVGI